jgi:hypothetical protein
MSIVIVNTTIAYLEAMQTICFDVELAYILYACSS